MHKNDCLDAVVQVLLEHGLSYLIEYGGKHIKVRFKVKGRRCFATVPVTPSDRRGPMNARAEARRKIRVLEAEAAR